MADTATLANTSWLFFRYRCRYPLPLPLDSTATSRRAADDQGDGGETPRRKEVTEGTRQRSQSGRRNERAVLDFTPSLHRLHSLGWERESLPEAMALGLRNATFALNSELQPGLAWAAQYCTTATRRPAGCGRSGNRDPGTGREAQTTWPMYKIQIQIQYLYLYLANVSKRGYLKG